jgi:DNA-binding IclR family transcriptional regulator
MIQSVERAAVILSVLGSGTPRLGVTEIADRVGLAKPTVHGLLRTLVTHDLVTQDPASGKYSLGAGVLRLGNAYLGGSELRACSLHWAQALAQQADEAVWVATLSGTQIIVLHHMFRPVSTARPAATARPGGTAPAGNTAPGENTVQILEVGAAVPWHACALGHAIVAYLPDDEVTRVLAAERAPLTGRTKTSRAALIQALGRVRRRGYAIEDQEATVGDAGIAAPIIGGDGRVTGAIGLVGPAGRLLAPDARDGLARAVTDSALSVSHDLSTGRGTHPCR